MKKINDSKLFFYTGITTLVFAVLIGAVSYYSILVIEPKIAALVKTTDAIVISAKTAQLSAEQSKLVSENYKKAYVMLRDPEIFGRYEYFDYSGDAVRNILRDFDAVVYAGEPLPPDSGRYLYKLLERRELGSRLGRNTSVFLFVLSVFAFGFFLYERKCAKN